VAINGYKIEFMKHVFPMLRRPVGVKEADVRDKAESLSDGLRRLFWEATALNWELILGFPT